MKQVDGVDDLVFQNLKNKNLVVRCFHPSYHLQNKSNLCHNVPINWWPGSLSASRDQQSELLCRLGSAALSKWTSVWSDASKKSLHPGLLVWCRNIVSDSQRPGSTNNQKPLQPIGRNLATKGQVINCNDPSTIKEEWEMFLWCLKINLPEFNEDWATICKRWSRLLQFELVYFQQ